VFYTWNNYSWTKKRITEIEIGDIVKGKTRDNKVLATPQFIVGENLLHGFNGIDPFITSCHPIFTKTGWSAFNIEILKEKWPTDYDIIVKENNGSIYNIDDQSEILFYQDEFKFNKIENVKSIQVDSNFKVYNLILDGDHTFIANDVMVHNKCFEAGTRVLLANGTVKNIEDVEIGEYLLGENNSSNRLIEYHRPILGLKDEHLANKGLKPLQMISINKGLFRASEDHLFKTPDGWKAVNKEKSELIHSDMLKNNKMTISELKLGDHLITHNNALILVENIELHEGDDPNLQLYNFKLDGNNTYYVELFKDTFVLVHNKKIICTKLYELGLMSQQIYEADQAFGEKLMNTHPDIYNGYRAWADIVVDWMSGQGPKMMPWMTDKEFSDSAQFWSTSWAQDIATPWAKHMAYKMGAVEKDNFTGRMIALVGVPICKIVGVWQRIFGPSKSPAGFGKGAMLIPVFVLFKLVAKLGKFIESKKS